MGPQSFNPHSLRSTLVQLGELLCRTPEDFKAWSQNLGHEEVLTTFRSYGAVGTRRQCEIIRNVANPQPSERPEVVEFAKAVVRELARSEWLFQTIIVSEKKIVGATLGALGYTPWAIRETYQSVGGDV
jgi:hypothetical protein